MESSVAGDTDASEKERVHERYSESRVSCNAHPVQMDYEKAREKEKEDEMHSNGHGRVFRECKLHLAVSVHTRQKESRVEQDASVAANATCPLHK